MPYPAVTATAKRAAPIVSTSTLGSPCCCENHVTAVVVGNASRFTRDLTVHGTGRGTGSYGSAGPGSKAKMP